MSEILRRGGVSPTDHEEANMHTSYDPEAGFMDDKINKVCDVCCGLFLLSFLFALVLVVLVSITLFILDTPIYSMHNYHILYALEECFSYSSSQWNDS